MTEIKPELTGSIFQCLFLALFSDLDLAVQVLRRKSNYTQTPLEAPDDPSLAIKKGVKENAERIYIYA